MTFEHYVPLDRSVDLLLRILPRLNMNSIIAFLNTFPSARDQTVLITDHPFAPLFFRIDGIKRRHNGSQSYDRVVAPTYDRAIDKEPIKLMEITLESSVGRRYAPAPSKYTPGITLKVHDFDERTFAFFTGPPTLDFHTSFLHDPEWLHELHISGCKWHNGLSSLPTDQWDSTGIDGIDASLMYNMKQLQPLPSSILNLRSLIIHDHDRVENITLSNTEFLIIDMTHCTEVRPVIRNIAVPLLKKLVIRYCGLLPVIEGIDAGRSHKIYDYHTYTDAKLEVFRTKLPAFELSDLRGVVPDGWEDNESMRLGAVNVDLSFLKGFKSLLLSGVPDYVFERADLSTIESMKWAISMFKPREKLGLLMPSLRHLDLTCWIEGCRLPVIKGAHLDVLSVVLTKPGIWADDLLNSVGQASTSITLFQTDYAVQKSSICQLVVPSLARVIPKGRSSSLLSLFIGGFDLSVIAWDHTSLTCGRETILCPVVTDGTIVTARFQVPEPSNITLIPIFLKAPGTDSNADGKKVLISIRTVSTAHKVARITVPLCAEKVYFNYKLILSESNPGDYNDSHEDCHETEYYNEHVWDLLDTGDHRKGDVDFRHRFGVRETRVPGFSRPLRASELGEVRGEYC